MSTTFLQHFHNKSNLNLILRLLFCPTITTSNNLPLKICCKNIVDISFLNIIRHTMLIWARSSDWSLSWAFCIITLRALPMSSSWLLSLRLFLESPGSKWPLIQHIFLWNILLPSHFPLSTYEVRNFNFKEVGFLSSIIYILFPQRKKKSIFFIISKCWSVSFIVIILMLSHISITFWFIRFTLIHLNCKIY